MELQGASVNRVFAIKSKKKEDFLYEWWDASSIYAADLLTFKFCKYTVPLIGKDKIEALKTDFLKVFDIQTPYLLGPFEVGIYEDLFYQAFLQTGDISLYSLTSTSVKFPYEIALKIVINILRGLVILEKKGLHHNLLAPQQIYLTETDQDITNIKITGFFDYYLLRGAEKDFPAFEKNYGRYFFLKNYSLLNIESKLENDIYSVGVILLEMLTGRASVPLKDIDLPKDIPGWINATVRKMLDSPESFSTIQSLFDIFITNSPEHSILEDAIDDRLEGKGESSNTENTSMELEELPMADGDDIPGSNKMLLGTKVKSIIYKIFSVFRRKKIKEKGTFLNYAFTEDSDSGLKTPSENNISNKLSKTGKIDPDPSLSKSRFSGFPGDASYSGKDPWVIDEKRYKGRDNSSGISIPSVHNAGGAGGAEDELSSLEERKYSNNEHGLHAENEKKSTTIPAASRDAQKTVEMLKSHRSNDNGLPAVPSKSKNDSLYTNGNKGNDQTYFGIKNSNGNSSIHDFSSDSGEEASDVIQDEVKPGELTNLKNPVKVKFFRRFLSWLKKLFFRQ